MARSRWIFVLTVLSICASFLLVLQGQGTTGHQSTYIHDANSCCQCTKEIGTVKVEKAETFGQTIAETKLLSVADYDHSICREELQRVLTFDANFPRIA